VRTATFLLIMVAAPAAAQDAIPLKWSLKEGDKFFAKNDTDMKMNMTVMGQDVEMKMSVNVVQRYKVIAAKQNSTTVEMTMLSMGMEMKALGMNLPGLENIGERVKGATITAILDENMSVTKIQGYDKFLDQLAGDDKTMRKTMKQSFSEDSMRQMFGMVFSFGTNKPVKIGDKWDRNEKMSISGMEATVKQKFKLDSVDSGIAKLSFTGDMEFKAGGALPGLPEGVKVDKFDMKAEKFGGGMKFDTKLGRLTESTQDMVLDGSMSVGIAGQMLDVGMKIKGKTVVTIVDKNPVKD
jgi:hypothetical protein